MDWSKNKIKIVIGAILLISLGFNIQQIIKNKKIESELSSCYSENYELERKFEDLEDDWEECKNNLEEVQEELEDCQTQKRRVESDLEDKEFDDLFKDN